ncbi:olfactory receptor 56A4-like [Pleurodeles waltl]|uniref:olfactory receptor 56A4-like n=1 Tax=Pleurodeles waltl TaxID=8319 RepID=UPI003709BEA2
MVSVNTTFSVKVTHFEMICFPSYQSWQHWLSVPLTLLFFSAVVANVTILTVIRREQRLHEPMYYFIGFLGVIDVVLCTCTIPKTLGILYFNWKEIEVTSCLIQMYMINGFFGSQSATFLVMAFDRYVAICNPLRYSSMITIRFVGKAIAFILVRDLLVSVPYPVLAAQLPHCSANIKKNCICTVASVSALACGYSKINKVYQLSLAFILLGGDLIFICLSYCLILGVVFKLRAKGAVAKALNTCTPHLILVCFFYTLLLVLIFTNTMEKTIPPDIPILLNVLHLVIPPSLNPIVYGLRTKEVKLGILKLIGLGNTNAP